MKIYVVYDTHFGMIDSIWRDPSKAFAAAKKANERMKAFGQSRFFAVNEHTLED